MTKSPNPIPEEWLSAYLDDELSDQQRQQVEQAIAQDPQLAHLLDELQAARQLVRKLPNFPDLSPRMASVSKKQSMSSELDDGLDNPEQSANLTSSSDHQVNRALADESGFPSDEKIRFGSPSTQWRYLRWGALAASLMGIAFIAQMLWPSIGGILLTQKATQSTSPQVGNLGEPDAMGRVEQGASRESFDSSSGAVQVPAAVLSNQLSIDQSSSDSAMARTENLPTNPAPTDPAPSDPSRVKELALSGLTDPGVVEMRDGLQSESLNRDLTVVENSAATDTAAKAGFGSRANQGAAGSGVAGSGLGSPPPSARSLLLKDSQQANDAMQLKNAVPPEGVLPPTSALPPPDFRISPSNLAAESLDGAGNAKNDSQPAELINPQKKSITESTEQMNSTQAGMGENSTDKKSTDDLPPPRSIDNRSTAERALSDERSSLEPRISPPHSKDAPSRSARGQAAAAKATWHRSSAWTDGLVAGQLETNTLLHPLRSPLKQSLGAAINAEPKVPMPTAILRVDDEQRKRIVQRLKAIQLSPAFTEPSSGTTQVFFLSEDESRRILLDSNSDTATGSTDPKKQIEAFWVSPVKPDDQSPLRILIINER